MIRVSAVSYTNTLPFIFGLENSSIKEKIDLSLDIPSHCAKKLLEGKADIGLIPVAAILDLPEHYIISDYCIGATGAVNSVFIFSNCPLEEIEFLQLDPQSRSSNNLALVLLKNYWKLNPENIINAQDYSQSKHPKTAYVQIGDRTFGKTDKYPYVYDLAQEWYNFTGLPFVFAAWVSNKKLTDEFIAELNKAFQFGLDNRKEVLKSINNIYPDFDMEDYLMNKIDYTLDDKKKEALQLFHKLIKEL